MKGTLTSSFGLNALRHTQKLRENEANFSHRIDVIFRSQKTTEDARESLKNHIFSEGGHCHVVCLIEKF